MDIYEGPKDQIVTYFTVKKTILLKPRKLWMAILNMHSRVGIMNVLDHLGHIQVRVN